MPLLARGGAKKARLWTYVRDDRPWNGGAPPAAVFHFSRDRSATNPNRHLSGWQGVLQAEAYGGYNDLYRVDRVAVELGETVDRIFDLTVDMETANGVIWIYGPGDDRVTAFTPFGIENLRELIEIDRYSAR